MTDLTPPVPAHPTVSIEQEMRTSYLDYAMSVIVSRALPDVRDGLKPVHRRILYAMKEGGYTADKPFRKSARIVGDVMGKYHPHGDSAIYDAMVRMAQPFSLRLMLVDGQGNYGSMDGDAPAAMRYTEARLARSAEEMLLDIDKETVDFIPNYDDSLTEPAVLPASFPNLLVNGGGGIAVGMATNIPPHNLGEVIDAACALIDDPDLGMDELRTYILGPDFPTGGMIVGRRGIKSAFEEGRGSIIMRGKTHFEPYSKDKQRIVITEIPYQVNKAKLVERVGELVREKMIEGIAEIRDESDRDGVRVVIELKKDIEPEIILNQLFKHTSLQTSFGVNLVALNDRRPLLMNVRDVLTAFLHFREDVIRRRTIYLLKKARERAHLLVGLSVAVANIDDIIALIKAAPSPKDAKEQLMAKAWPLFDLAPIINLIEPDFSVSSTTYTLSALQAQAILDMRLHRLTGLEREKLQADLRDIVAKIEDLMTLLRHRDQLLALMKSEMLVIKEKYGTPRRTEIVEDTGEVNIEDLIQREDMVVTMTHHGYIKRVPLSAYRAQKRGGKGRSGMDTKTDDFVSTVHIASTHTPLLFFSNLGKVYYLKVYNLPSTTPQARGRPIVQMLSNIQPHERISAVLPLPESVEPDDQRTIVFATSSGNVRRNRLSDFTNIKANGKIAMKLDDGDLLVGVAIVEHDEDVFLATKESKCIRFGMDELRVFESRNSSGVRGVRLADSDRVISLSLLKRCDFTMEEREAYRIEQAKRSGQELANPDNLSLSAERFAAMQAEEEFILTVSDQGFGKRSSAYEYRRTGRGGMGIAAMEMTKKTGKMADAFPIKNDDQIMLVTDQGQMIRCGVADVRIAGRKTQGVTLFKVSTGEHVVSVGHMAGEDDDGEEGKS